MWCLTMANGTRSFHPTAEAAEQAAVGDTAHVIWYDAFDYELHNPDRPTWLRTVADAERAAGLAYVAELIEELRTRWEVSA